MEGGAAMALAASGNQKGGHDVDDIGSFACYMTGVTLKPIPPMLRHCPRPCQRDGNNPARGGGGTASGSLFGIPPFLATV